jgi:hypothetical protein
MIISLDYSSSFEDLVVVVVKSAMISGGEFVGSVDC